MEDEGKDIRFFIKSAIFFMNNTTQHKLRILQSAFRNPHSAIGTADFFMDVTEVLIVLSRVKG